MQQRGPQDVQRALDDLGLDITVRIFEESTATAELAAAAIGTELGAIVKSLCFMVSGQPVVILAAGDQRVDARKVAGLYGVSKKRVRIAQAAETLAATGYPPGGVPPVGHMQRLPVLIDATLARFSVVYGAAGSANAIFPIPFALLAQATGGQVVDVALAPGTASGDG